MSVPILLLRLEGPLQSWGERARWDLRDSASFPTKSAVIGIIACAMGLPRGSAEIVRMHSELRMAVRADRLGSMMTDYHTISGLISTASGGQRGNKGEMTTIVSERQYIQDGSFLIGLSGSAELLQQSALALQDPVWPVFLGRKSCPPARPVLGKIALAYDSLLEAMRGEPVDSRNDGAILLCEIEDERGTILRRDVATMLPSRAYLERPVKVETIETEGAF